MLPIRVCILLASVGLVSASGKSTTIAEFLSITNGNFNNMKQVQEGATDHAFIHYKFFPVNVPSLRPLAVWYTEWVSNRSSTIRTVGVMKQGLGDTIHVTLYKYRDLSIDRSSTFKASKLQHLKEKDLWDTNCAVEISKLRDGMFWGHWFDCDNYVNGFHAFYSGIYECNGSKIETPPTIPGSFSQTPYIFQRTGDRYPMTGVKDYYNEICGGKQ